jgi:hypothetical protein
MSYTFEVRGKESKRTHESSYTSSQIEANPNLVQNAETVRESTTLAKHDAEVHVRAAVKKLDVSFVEKDQILNVVEKFLGQLSVDSAKDVVVSVNGSSDWPNGASLTVSVCLQAKV